MKIETQPLEDHQVKLTVEVEADSFESAKKRAARQLSRKTKIPGFRPGKAPYPVIARQIGEATIIEEALDLLVQEIYPKIIDESEIKPYGPGNLENVVSMDPPVLEFVVPLEAEVELGDYRSISQPYEPKQITEKEIEDVLSDLQERQAVLEPADRPAQEGDKVFTRLSGTRTNVEEGENPTLVSEQAYPIQIKAESTDSDDEDASEWPFPGFSRNLIGHSSQDELTLTHTFSEDSDFETLRGAEAEFHIVIEDVKSQTLPELNDDFASSLGEYENMEALRQDIRESLEQQALQTYNEDYDSKVLEEAIDQATIKYPPQMLEREIDSVIHNLEHRLQEQNLDMELYLKTRDMDMDALREEARPVAESRLKQTLVLFELAKAENIEVESEELQNETLRTMSSLTRTMSEKEARQLNNEAVFSNLVSSIMADMLTQRSIERLRKIASGQLEEEETTAEEEQGAEATNEAVSQTSEEQIVPEVLPAEETPETEGQDASAETVEDVAALPAGDEISQQEPESSSEEE